MLNQKKLAVAVTVALGASVGALSVAQASSTLLFPMVVGSQTVASIVTVINTSNGAFIRNFTNGNLHLTLWSKDAGSNSDKCNDFNEYVSTSLNDIATFDLFGEFGQDTNGMLFENNVTTRNVDWRGDNTWSIGDFLPKPQRGFLLVDNTDASSITDSGTLRGEIFIFEFAGGATWGYQAASRKSFDYSTAASLDNNSVGIMPYDEIDTALMVTPVGGVSPKFQNTGDLSTTITLTQYAGGTPGFFDRDENPVSRTGNRPVVCVGRVDVDELFWGKNAIPQRYIDGGWTTVEIDKGGTNSDSKISNAVVFKLEYNTTDTFNGESVTGTFNNATHLLPANNWVQ